ncbi:MAG: trypsin-like serine protease [Ruminococcaceae bacterium]|nr:trypsin-like serine protease [Oscillospiraceae bacterium]
MTPFDENSFEKSQSNDNSPSESRYKNIAGEFAAGNEGEYHYIRPEATRRAYSDASYIPADRAGAVPQNYHCREHLPEKKKKDRSARRGMPAAAVIALCLVCAILGGVGGGAFAGNYFARHIEDYLPDESDFSIQQDSGLFLPKDETTLPDSSAAIADSGSLALKDIYALACKQVVAVTTEITYKNFFGYTTSSAVSGSGFIISEDGYILTNFHVIEEAAKGGYEISVLTHDGSEYIASIVGFEADNDVAVLKIEAENLSPVSIGNSDNMSVGDSVYAVGNPLGELEYTMTGGMVSALDRDISTYDSALGAYTTINMFQIDAAVNSGNSGGPVYNRSGQVIGIVTAKYSNTGVEGLGFAVPINDAVKIAEDLINNGYVSGKAYLGIQADTLPASVSQYYSLPAGAYVVSVEPGSCADKAGLEAGDIITAIDGKAIRSSDELIAVKKDYRAGDEAVLTVSRSDGDIQLQIVFDEELPNRR